MQNHRDWLCDGKIKNYLTCLSGIKVDNHAAQRIQFNTAHAGPRVAETTFGAIAEVL